MKSQPHSSERYSRQIRLSQIGKEGQEILQKSDVAILGAGALGSVLASLCARSGIGRVRIIDRDIVEIHNLQRQILYDEEDVKQNIPKAVAAKKKLLQINSSIEVESHVEDLTPRNIAVLLEKSHLILDGTDNFQTRFLINDFSQKYEIPWIYAGVISTYGHGMAILPGRSPCFRCYLPEAPAPGESGTCDVVGVLGSAVQIIASFAFNQGLKILLHQQVQEGLMMVDSWNPSLRILQISKDPECLCCGQKQYIYLDSEEKDVVTLCGNDAVQIRSRSIDLAALQKKLSALGEVKYNSYLLKFTLGDKSLTAFQDGRVIITGTSDPSQARSFFARYVGS